MSHKVAAEVVLRTGDVGPDVIRTQLCPLITVPLHAGDVILTRGRGPESAAIAAMSGGLYSHAAVCLPSNAASWAKAPLSLFESDDSGVGESTIVPMRLVLSPHVEREAVALGSDVATAVLLRHPAVAQLSRKRITDAATRLRERHSYRAYSNMSRLVETLDWGYAIKNVMKSSLDYIYGLETPEIAGAFCSEIVMLFYNELGLQILRDGSRPEKVSPNHLIGARSFLEVQEGAVTLAGGISDDVHGTLYMAGTREWQRKLLARNVSTKRQNIQIKNLSEKLKERLINTRDEALISALKASTDRLYSTMQTLNSADAIGYPAFKEKLAIHVEVAIFIELALRRFDSIKSSSDLSRIFVLNKIINMGTQSSNAYLRTFILAMLSAMRHNNAINGTGRYHSFEEKRRELLKEWIKTRSIETVEIYDLIPEDEHRTAAIEFTEVLSDAADELLSRRQKIEYKLLYP